MLYNRGVRLVRFAIVAAAVVVVSPSAASARSRSPLRACGQVVTRIPHTGALKDFNIDRVSARRVPCAQARGFVRTWGRLANQGKLGNGVAGKTRNSVLVYNQWGPAYHDNGYVCRSMALAGPGPVQRERVTCGGPAGLITFYEFGRSG